MKTVSLDAIRDKEHNMLDNDYDGLEGLSIHTPVDRYMELNDGRMGEDSEELAVREKHQSRMLSQRPFPSYQPY